MAPELRDRLRQYECHDFMPPAARGWRAAAGWGGATHETGSGLFPLSYCSPAALIRTCAFAPQAQNKLHPRCKHAAGGSSSTRFREIAPRLRHARLPSSESADTGHRGGAGEARGRGYEAAAARRGEGPSERDGRERQGGELGRRQARAKGAAARRVAARREMEGAAREVARAEAREAAQLRSATRR